MAKNVNRAFTTVDQDNLSAPIGTIPPDDELYTDDSDRAYSTEEPLRDREERTLSDLMGNLSDDEEVTIAVHRAAKGKARGAYIFQRPIMQQSFSAIMDELRDDFGGGEFRAFIHRGNHLIGNKSISVEPPKVVKPEYPVAIAGASANELLFAQMRDESRAANERFNTLLLKAFDSANRPPPVQQQTSAMEIVSLITALKGIDSGGGSSVKETLELLSTAKNLFGDGGGGGESLTDKLVSAGLPLLGEMAKAGVFTPKPAPIAPRAPVKVNPVSETVVPVSESTPEQATDDDDTQAMLRMMVRAAVGDKEPLPYAEIALDQFGGTMMETVCRSDDNFALFLLNIPETVRTDKSAWFVDFRTIVLELLDTPTDNGGNDPDDGETIPVLESDDAEETENLSYPRTA